MAKIYKSIDSYVDEMKKTFALPGSEGEGGRINADSGVRNYLAEQVQRLEDNGFDVSGIQEFYDAVGSKSSEGFGNLSGKKIGGREISAITYAMMQLDQLQADGKISVEDYAGYVNQLMSPESIEAIAGSGDNSTFTLFEDISNLAGNPVDEQLKKDNAEALAIGTRPYINGVNDYLESARAADPARDPNAEKPEGYDIDEELGDRLAEARDAGLLTEDQCNEARDALRGIAGAQYDASGMPISAANKEAMLYAMEDVIALGDADLAGRLMSQDGFSNIVSGTSQSEGVDLLREIEGERVQKEATHSEDAGPAEPGPEEPGPEEPGNTDGPSGDKPDAGFGSRDTVAIMDLMSEDYFAQSEANGGITMDDYAEQLSVYETLSGDDADRYYEEHPDFAEANEFMDRLDKLEQGVDDEAIYINVTEDQDGNKHYGIGYPGQDDGISDDERARAEFGSEFLDRLDVAANRTADPDYVAPGASGPEEPKDLDVGIAKINFEILSQQSPEERIRELQEVALGAWRDEYGHGQDRIDAWAAMGYDEETRKQIQEMVNMGDDWCRNMTVEDFDKAFPSADGTSLADQEAAFRAEQAQAAAYVMTYEGADDLKAAYDTAYRTDNPAAEHSPLDPEAAAAYYDQAAHILDGTYADGAVPDVSAEEAKESASNLADYVVENPDAGFETPAEEIIAYGSGEQPAAPEQPEGGGLEVGG